MPLRLKSLPSAILTRLVPLILFGIAVDQASINSLLKAH